MIYKEPNTLNLEVDKLGHTDLQQFLPTMTKFHQLKHMPLRDHTPEGPKQLSQCQQSHPPKTKTIAKFRKEKKEASFEVESKS